MYAGGKYDDVYQRIRKISSEKSESIHTNVMTHQHKCDDPHTQV